MNSIIHDKLALFIVPAGLLLAAPAWSQEEVCESDADCAEGQTCQKGMFVDPCAAPPSDGGDEETPACNTEPQESPTGYCYTPPTPCESDSECDEYLSCVDSGTGDCAVDSEGNMSCGETDSVKYCSVGSIACETDDECPREFECKETSFCLLIACAEGETDCPDPCTSSGEKECQPKEIACTEAADCPPEWSCVGNYIESCSGGGASPGSPGDDAGSEDTPEADGPPPDAPEDDVTCTREPTEGVCQPNAWGGGVFASDGVIEPAPTEDRHDAAGAPTGAPGESESASAGGGCSVARNRPPLDFAWVLGLLTLLPLVRRRNPA